MPRSACNPANKSRICAWTVTSSAGGRLVGDQQLRFAGQGDGDHHPLLHAAGELEGIFAEPPFRVGDTDLAQQFEHALGGRRTTQVTMPFEHFANLAADGQHRVQAGGRFLEDHRHPAAAPGTHVGFR